MLHPYTDVCKGSASSVQELSFVKYTHPSVVEKKSNTDEVFKPYVFFLLWKKKKYSEDPSWHFCSPFICF